MTSRRLVRLAAGWWSYEIRGVYSRTGASVQAVRPDVRVIGVELVDADAMALQLDENNDAYRRFLTA